MPSIASGVLEDWLRDPRHTEGYVLITRGQRIVIQADQTLPPGSVDRIENALRRSPTFRVAYATADAAVFVLADPERTG